MNNNENLRVRSTDSLWTWWSPCFLAITGLVLCPGQASSRSLADLLGPAGTVADPLQVELQRSISRGLDFPATATTPGFTYHYNPELNMFERTPGSLGPAFLERADTLGAGHFDIGVSMLYANPNELDGDDIEGSSRDVVTAPGVVSGNLDVPTVTLDEFDLDTFAFYTSATYGLTNRIDLNMLLPLFYTSLDVSHVATSTLIQGASRESAHEEAFGVGDLQLRGKYLVDDSGAVKGAAGVALRIPTGDEDDFQGIGDFTVTPSYVWSYIFGTNDLHSSVGFEANADDLERSRVNYGIGVSAGLLERLTVNLDFIGTSQIADDDVETTIAAPRSAFPVGQTPQDIDLVAQGSTTAARFTIDRVDTLYFAGGVKVALIGNLVAFGNAIVSLNNDGVRAQVIPAGGFEYTF
jgi:hypothetical protein